MYDRLLLFLISAAIYSTNLACFSVLFLFHTSSKVTGISYCSVHLTGAISCHTTLLISDDHCLSCQLSNYGTA